jgi:hypothetical protein
MIVCGGQVGGRASVETFGRACFSRALWRGDRRIWIVCIVGDDAADGLHLLISRARCVLQLDDNKHCISFHSNRRREKCKKDEQPRLSLLPDACLTCSSLVVTWLLDPIA